MAGITTTAVDELSYATYQERQQRETTQAQLHHRASQLHEAEHFAYQQGQWERRPYEGYAILSMVDTNPGNNGLRESLQTMQARMQACFNDPAAFFPLPVESFHQTVANTLSAGRFHEHIVANGLVDDYPSLVRQAFSTIPPATETSPIQMRLVGLSLFSSAIGILGTFDNEADYDRILLFRERFYADEALNRLTVRRTRPFIGHITLAYLGALLSDGEKNRLVATCADINQALVTEPLFFTISTTELRSYPNLAQFDTKPGYPVYSFVL